MIYSINHTTSYSYSGSVFLEPHTLRLYPRSDPGQKLLDHKISIIPEPAGMSHGIDIYGNSFTQIWFSHEHRKMTIKSMCKVETLRENPFDYYLTPNSLRIPVVLEPYEATDLQSSLARGYKSESGTEDIIKDMAVKFSADSRTSSTDFVLNLNNWIFQNISITERREPGVIPPHSLLEKKQGSCRDLAVLFIEICREAGIPARFVSGYQEGDPDIPEAELHAWAEVYLPGVGWRGYDPTHGLAVADRHVALAASPRPEQTMAVSGTFRGTGVSSEIRHAVVMHAEA